MAPVTLGPAEWKARMEHALCLSNDERFGPCIAECRALLSYDELSRYYQIHCHALIAAALDDCEEAEYERVLAETMWSNCRYLWPLGYEEATDRLMAELRTILDNLAEDMLEDRRAQEAAELSQPDEEGPVGNDSEGAAEPDEEGSVGDGSEDAAELSQPDEEASGSDGSEDAPEILIQDTSSTGDTEKEPSNSPLQLTPPPSP